MAGVPGRVGVAPSRRRRTGAGGRVRREQASRGPGTYWAERAVAGCPACCQEARWAKSPSVCAPKRPPLVLAPPVLWCTLVGRAAGGWGGAAQWGSHQPQSALLVYPAGMAFWARRRSRPVPQPVSLSASTPPAHPFSSWLPGFLCPAVWQAQAPCSVIVPAGLVHVLLMYWEWNHMESYRACVYDVHLPR